MSAISAPLWLSDPAAPLRAFSLALGIPAEIWPGREGLTQVTYDDQELSRDVVAALRLDQITPLADAYGDALTCRFYLGDIPVLDVRSGITGANLDEFRDQTISTPSVRFDIKLDKVRLVADWLGAQPHTRLFLYLFPEALERLLVAPLPRLETLLWGTEPNAHVIVLVPRRDVWLLGERLAILGGARIGAWRTALPATPPDAARIREVYDQRADTVRWQETWLTFLTPLHLHSAGHPTGGDPIADAVRTHLANLIVMYTADRTALRAGRWVSTYTGAQEAVELQLASPDDPLGQHADAYIEVLYRLFDWVYDPKWAVDRLQLVQITAAQMLHELTPPDRYRRLLERAEPFYKDLQRQWKSFMEGKVDAYTDQVRALEDYVAATVQLFADQGAAITKSLSDTMLAAVAALLVSFIAAIFQSAFNQAVFTLGMIVYAVYVLGFPLVYNMLYQWQRYGTLVNDFEARRRRFEERLSEEQVEEIVATHVMESRTRFRQWFWSTVAIYAVTVVLAMTAATVVPKIVGVAPRPHIPVITHTSPTTTLRQLTSTVIPTIRIPTPGRH